MPQVLNVLTKTPEWIRHDLMSKDAISRERAQEALAAMIVAALGDSISSS